MPDTVHCPTCGSPLPPDAPQGECPRCLLRAGLESEPAVAGFAPSGSSSGFAPTRTSSGHGHFVPPTVAELQQRIPQYEILELIGQGGMGAVYKARQRGLERLVAIKILPFEVSQSASFTDRFSREARALALLSHPHIVAVHDFGQAEGMCYFVMEYVAGVNLRQAIQAGRMNPAEALAIVPQICEALQFAHDEGVVHRDIKPENILIDTRGRVKIADFGLAKLLGTQTPEHSLTGTQQVMGTLRYMAPEQMFGTKDVDHRADIFSLGVVFYELLTGELPIGRFAPPSKKCSIDARLDDVVLRALEAEPAQRYQHVSELKTGVDAIARSPAPQPAAPQPAAQHPPSRGEWEQLLDETDRTIRLRQHALLLTGFGVGAVGVIFLLAGPIVFAVPAITITSLLWMVAGLHSQHWEVICAGQRIVFENQIFFGSQLYVNGRLAQRGKFGYRNELAATLPDGSGRTVVALTEAGFWHFRCRLLLQPALAGAPPMEPNRMQPAGGFAGSLPHLLICLVLSLGLLWFVLYFVRPVFLMMVGPDTELLRVGRDWDLGSSVGAIFSNLLVAFLALAGATVFAWWKYNQTARDVAMPAPTRNTRENNSLPLSAEPRLSRAALWGAIVAPFFLFTVVMIVASTVVVQKATHDSQASTPTWLSLLVMIPLAALGLVGLCTPFATTLLGVVAIGQIRRSNGKLYGLPLAVFDALVFPLLALSGLLLLGSYPLLDHFFTEGLELPYNTPLRNWGPLLLTALVVLPFVIILNVWLIRLTWHAAMKGMRPTYDMPNVEKKSLPEPPPFQPASVQKTSTALVVVLVVLALLTVPLLVICGIAGTWSFTPMRDESPMAPPPNSIDTDGPVPTVDVHREPTAVQRPDR